MSSKKKCFMCGYFFSSAVATILIGINLIYFGPHLQQYVVKNVFILTPNSRVYNIWKKPPFEVSMNFYFFNWTNPEDIYNNSIKPKFQQVGPYKFSESQVKTDIVWNDNGTISFKRRKFWNHLEEVEAGNLQDSITTINPIGLTTAHVSRNWNSLVKNVVSIALLRLAPTINMTRTVSQLLFEGYPDTLMTIAKTFPFFADKDLPKWDKFGWFYERNGSSFLDGTFTMGTGNHTPFGVLDKWNHWSKTPYFDDRCGEVGNSYIDVFEPCENKTSITLFSSDACRRVLLQYTGKVKYDGVTANKYAAGDYMFDNGTLYPENKCFCSGDCLPAGVFNTSSCRFGTPSFISLPHFHKADSYYKNLVEGLEPDAQKHEFFVSLEPITGVQLEIVARLQLNLFVQPISGVTTYEKAPRVFFPVMWFEQKMKMPSNEMFLLNLLINLPLICCVIGIVIILLGVLLFIYVLHKYFDVSIFKKKNVSHLYQFETEPLKK